MSPATRSFVQAAVRGFLDRLDLGAAQARLDVLLDGCFDRILRADAGRNEAGRQQDGEFGLAHELIP
jgi:hypothetical protein